MKLLVDQNISFRFVNRLLDAFPNMTHVKEQNLMERDDYEIFTFAREHQFDAIVTLDSDFLRISLERGVPPKIIWVRAANLNNADMAQKFLSHKSQIMAFISDLSSEVLEIY